jgi:hypothetical protein
VATGENLSMPEREAAPVQKYDAASGIFLELVSVFKEKKETETLNIFFSQRRLKY